MLSVPCDSSSTLAVQPKPELPPLDNNDREDCFLRRSIGRSGNTTFSTKVYRLPLLKLRKCKSILLYCCRKQALDWSTLFSPSRYGKMCRSQDSAQPADDLTWEELQLDTSNRSVAQIADGYPQESSQLPDRVSDTEVSLLEAYTSTGCHTAYAEYIDAMPASVTDLTGQHQLIDGFLPTVRQYGIVSPGDYPTSNRSSETGSHFLSDLSGQTPYVLPTVWTVEHKLHQRSQLEEHRTFVPNEQRHFQDHHHGMHHRPSPQRPRDVTPQGGASDRDISLIQPWKSQAMNVVRPRNLLWRGPASVMLGSDFSQGMSSQSVARQGTSTNPAAQTYDADDIALKKG